MQKLTPFQQSALDYKSHISLTANAGSGKTFVLAKRYVEIAVNENISLSKIIAITFTEKAAGELNKKIAAEIDERLIKDVDSDKYKTLQRVRRQLTSANISTIHSFCINLLKEFSPEVGIDANFVPINQQDADELLDITINDFFTGNLSGTTFESELKKIVRLLGGRNQFVKEIKSIVKSRKAISKLRENIFNSTDSDIIDYYEQNIDGFLNSLMNDELNPLCERIKQLNRIVFEYYEDNSVALEVDNVLSIFNSETDDRKKIKLLSSLADQLLTKSNFTIKKRDYLKSDIEVDSELISDIENKLDSIKSLLNIEFNRKHLQKLIDCAKSILNLSSGILSEYDERKRKSGFLDFEDMLIKTKELTQKENFDELFKNKYEYIMIDEYQDTNEIQYEIFMPILDNLNRGNLFIVGDEKQSIYKFREAELEVFNRTKSEIKNKSPEGELLLPHSFRLAPAIAHFTNELFSNLLINPKQIYNEVEYKELICSRSKDDIGAVELLVNTSGEKSESILVASKILELRQNRDSKWNETAILCRKRNHFIELEKSLNEFGIPYVIAGGKGFYQRQTIYDIYNYIAFLLNPGDDTALVGLLRSPFYLFDDEFILRVSRNDGNNLYEKLKSVSGNSKVTTTVKSLEKHLSLASSIRLSALLREIFSSTNYWGIASAKRNSVQEVSNLFKLFGIARKFSLQSFKTLYDFKVFLNEAIISFEDEGQAQIATSSDAVKIMTLHQAKGLEFKNVFLYKCNESNKDKVVKSKSIEIDKTWGVVTKVPENDSYFKQYVSPSVVDIYNFIENRKEIAESKRIFYVGITRAADNLFLTASIVKDKVQKNSFMDFLFTALNSRPDKESIILDSKLKFMGDAESDFEITEESFLTEIQIRKDIIAPSSTKTENEKPINEFSVINTEKITDHEKNEIVSATKIAIFKQCPTKYYLTYELGYTELLKITKPISNSYDFKIGEDENLNIFADIRGQIIHKLLEEEITKEKLSGRVNQLLLNYENRIGQKKEALIQSILEDINNYLGSSTYKNLTSYKNFKNEFEIYAKETDYFVYGIIDKLIFEDDRLTLIDYKTDNVSISQITEKKEHYIPQLKFYAYTLSRLFSKSTSIKVQLVFIKHPEEQVELLFNKKEIEEFGKEIRSIVLQIRSQNFNKNLEHCRKCHFNIDGNCVFQK